jgi:hypothetical protein
MPVVAVQRQRSDLPVVDAHAGVVGVGAEFGVHAQPGAGGRGGDGLHDDFVAGQWSSAPVHGEVGKQPVLDLVPFRGAGPMPLFED